MVYRAAISLRKPRDTKEALRVVEELDEYTHLPGVRTPEDYGRYELNRLLDESDAAFILDNINLESYGKDLQENRGVYLTDYGAMERKDGRFIYEIKEDPNWDRRAFMSGPKM